MNRIVLKLVFAVFLVFICHRSWADETQLQSFVAEALKNNPQLKAERQHLEAVRSRIPQASALPDPTVGYDVMGSMLQTRLGPQEEVYEFEQMIPFPGKLIEKRKAARAEMEAAKAKLSASEREVIQQVSKTYYDLYSIDRTILITQEVKELLVKFESITQSRYASEGGSQRDVAKAQAEVSMVIQQLFILKQKRVTAQALLQNLLGRQLDQDIQVTDELTLPNENLAFDGLEERLKESNPEVLEASAVYEREKHNLRLAKYENAPDFSVGFKYIGIGSGETTNIDDGKDAWMVPIRVTIPLWQNRIGAGIREARSNLASSEDQLNSIHNLAEYQLKDAFIRYTTQKNIVDLYENALIPQAELAFKSDQTAYESGRSDILNLIDSEKVYLNAKADYYQAKAETMKSLADMERILGNSILMKEKAQ